MNSILNIIKVEAAFLAALEDAYANESRCGTVNITDFCSDVFASVTQCNSTLLVDGKSEIVYLTFRLVAGMLVQWDPTIDTTVKDGECSYMEHYHCSHVLEDPARIAEIRMCFEAHGLIFQ